MSNSAVVSERLPGGKCSRKKDSSISDDACKGRGSPGVQSRTADAPKTSATTRAQAIARQRCRNSPISLHGCGMAAAGGLRNDGRAAGNGRCDLPELEAAASSAQVAAGQSPSMSVLEVLVISAATHRG